jgi:hypothetical protein
MPFNVPPKPTYHRHHASRRHQQYSPTIYEAERDGHRVHHWASWTGTDHYYIDGPPAVSESFSSHGSSSCPSHQLAHGPVWPPEQSHPHHDGGYQHDPYHRQQLQPPPPPPLVVSSLARYQAPAIDRSINATPADFFEAPPSSTQQQPFHHPAPFVYDLREADVLCGRGAPSNFHGGNRIFKDLVVHYQSSYLAARRHDKPDIAAAIVQHIHDRGGRFLKRIKMEGRGPMGHFCWYVFFFLFVVVVALLSLFFDLSSPPLTRISLRLFSFHLPDHQQRRPKNRQEIDQQRAYEKACQALREGAPELRRQLAAKEIAAAASCLDRFNRHHGATAESSLLSPTRSSDTTTTLSRNGSCRSHDDNEEEEDRGEAPEAFHDGCQRE